MTTKQDDGHCFAELLTKFTPFTVQVRGETLEEMTSSTSWKAFGIILLILCLVPTIGYTKCRVVEHENKSEVVCEDVPPPPKPAIEEEKEKADEAAMQFNTCKNQISSVLKAPATAIYQLIETYYSYGDKNMKIAVDAHNSYGALVRDYYICIFDTYSRIKHFKRASEL